MNNKTISSTAFMITITVIALVMAGCSGVSVRTPPTPSSVPALPTETQIPQAPSATSIPTSIPTQPPTDSHSYIPAVLPLGPGHKRHDRSNRLRVRRYHRFHSSARRHHSCEIIFPTNPIRSTYLARILKSSLPKPEKQLLPATVSR